MATEVWPELTIIQDEDVLRKMWQETEDFGRKKEIRARMYKLREQRLKDFYTAGDTQSEVTVRKTKTHTESIGDQGSFATMKSKEIRDSESPTRDISITRRGETWSSGYEDDRASVRSDRSGVSVKSVHQSMVPAESTEVVESQVATGKSSSQRVSQTSVQSSSASSQSIVKSSKSESRTFSSGSTQNISTQDQISKGNVGQITSNNEGSSSIRQITSGSESNVSSDIMQISNQGNVSSNDTQRFGNESNIRLISSRNDSNVTSSVGKVSSDNVSNIASSQFQRVTSGSQKTTSESCVQQGGEQTVTRTRTIKQSSSSTPDVITTTVTYTSSDPSQPPVQQTTVRSIQSSDNIQGLRDTGDITRSGVVETRTIIRSEPQVTRSITESVNRSQQVQQSSQSQQTQQTSSTSHSTQSSSIQKSSTSQHQSQNITQSNKSIENQYSTSGNKAIQSSNITEVQKHDATTDSARNIQDSKLQKHDVQITEVDSRVNTDSNVKNVSRADSKMDVTKSETVKTSDVINSQKTVKAVEDKTVRQNNTKQIEDNQIKSSTDQKILTEIKKLDTFLSTQPSPSNSVPMSPQINMDSNWPVDKDFVYTDTTPKSKPMVNGERRSPIRQNTNLKLPDGATEGQYVTTYQHDYTPRISQDHNINHQYFASTLRASPDRSSPSPSKRSSSKGSLDRSTPDRKFRGSPTRKTPDPDRRLSSSSYTIERISDNKRYVTDTKEKSQTLPKDKPRRKLSSTQSKTATKTRSSTPGGSPTASPTRVQRGRKPSLSDSDTDHSDATYNKKASSLKNIDTKTSNYGSTTRIRGSTASVNVTDNESRLVSSPSPNRYPARENTPDYSSEGSITRELRTARNIEKSNTTLDSSPERSAFAPIKSFRTSPERRDQTLNMINEERKHILQTDSNIDSYTVDTNQSTLRTDVRDRVSSVQDITSISPDSSPDRVSKDRTLSRRVSDSTKTETTGQKKDTPKSSPDRKMKQPDSYGKPRTPVSSPDRRSPSKPEKSYAPGRQSPTKSKPSQRTPDYSKPKVSKVGVAEKTTLIKKTTKTDSDRVTRRSSIPRAEMTKPSRPTTQPSSVSKPGIVRNTVNSTSRTTIIKNTSSPAPNQVKSSTVTKSVDRTSTTSSRTRDTKTTSPKKTDTITQKRPTYSRPTAASPSKPASAKSSPQETRPKTAKTNGYKSETLTKSDISTNKNKVSKTSIPTKKDQDVKTSIKKTKKEVTHTDSRDIIKTKLVTQTSVDKDSSESIEDEQPPEFFDDFDETDRVQNETNTFDTSSNFIMHETDTTVKSSCNTKVSEKSVNDSATTNRVIAESTKFISAEQTGYVKPMKPTQPSLTAPESSKAKKPKDKPKSAKKKPANKKGTRSSSSSSSDEDEIIIKYDDYSDVQKTETTQKKVIKRDVQDTQTTDKSRVNTLKVVVQHPQSSRDSSPEKSIPMSVASDGGQTPRYADFITEPEDVEVFDSSNLGPNKPIPSTLLTDNRILEESEDSSRETENVSVAERVSKYIEKTELNKIDIVTLDDIARQTTDSSDVLKTKEIFENITKQKPEETLERRDSKKFNSVNEFIQKESISSSETTSKRNSIDVVDKSLTREKETVKQEVQKAEKPAPKKQPSAEDILKKPERRLSEHSPDIESKRAFFEKKANDITITETAKSSNVFKSNSPFDQKVPNYMKETATAATRKESIQKEFAPIRQGTETDIQVSREKRSSVDVDRMDTFIKSETYHVCKDNKTSPLQTNATKDKINRRRSSAEVNELDTFKKSEAFITCENKSTRSVTEKRHSVDLQKNTTSSTISRKDSTEIKRKSSETKSPERSPTRRTSKDKSTERVPLKKKDTNIMSDVTVTETTKSGKFGVTLRRTSSSGGSGTPKSLHQDTFALPDDLPEIEEIFDLQILEILLTRAVLYEERRRIRAQIRVVKKKLEEQNHQPSRRPQTTNKIDRGTKDDYYQKKEVTTVEKTASRDRKRTPSPVKDDAKKPGYRTSPDRSVKIDRRDSQKTIEERKSSTDNSYSLRTVKTYTSPDKSYSMKQTTTETRSGTSPNRKMTTSETTTRKTPYQTTTESKTSSSYESKYESHSNRSSPQRSSPERKSPERKYEYDSRRTSETIKTRSPERKISKEYEMKSSFTKEERRTSDVRRSSKTSPERRVSTDSRRTSETKYSRTSPERKISTDVHDSSRTSSHVVKTSSHYTSTTSVGRKGEDSVTSSYGIGPTDNQGRPLFGLRALRSTNRTSDDAGEIEVGEDVGDGLIEDIRGSDGRPLFGLKAVKTSTTTTTSSVHTQDMPSTQHLVQKHQQFLSEVKTGEDKLRGSAPRARLRDSFILDNDENGTNIVSTLPTQGQGVSLKSIIQKHEDMATTGKNVKSEFKSTKTVTSSHGTISSDGKVSLSKNITHGEIRGKDGLEPVGRITSSQYSYRSPDDPTQKPLISSTTTTTHLGTNRNSITSLGEVRIEELNDSRRDSLVNSARKSLEIKQNVDNNRIQSSDQSIWQSEKKSLVRGDSIKALQNKFQQPTGINQVNQKPSYPKAGLILRSNSLTNSDEQNQISSALKRVSGEEIKSSKTEERRSSVKDETTQSTTTSVTSSTTRRDSGSTITQSSTRRDSGSNLTSKQTREGSKSATSFLDDTSKVTGVQDILQRMRNADLVTESSDTTEDAEARSLLNKFLGASVILQGMEAGGHGPASSALVSQVERQRILTSSQRKTDDIDDITDEKQLQILLEACSDYEQRRKIRARLRKIMADRKGGQGELIGGEEGEERREEFSESRQYSTTDGGSITKTEVHKTSSSTARLTKANSVQQSPFAKFRQLERQNSAPSGGALFKLTDPKLVRSASTIKDRLLCWARAQTSAYKNVQIDNFSTSWSNGLAFCALIHNFFPDAFDYDSLTPESRRHNFELAFRIAEERGDIYPLLDVDDMVAMRKPDWKCVFTYVQSIYRLMHNQPNAVKSISA